MERGAADLMSGLIGHASRAVGAAAGTMLARITGHGDYTVQKNSIAEGNAVPSFTASAQGTRICHREFLADVVGTTNFSNLTFNINPALQKTFPWLSQVAAMYELYCFDGLVFEYRPTSGSIGSATPSLGAVIMATDYNVAGIPFTTKQSMESYEFANSIVPCNGMLHPVECAPAANRVQWLYTRQSDVPSAGSAQLYDVGLFQIATQGMPSAYTCGELWVTYDVRLSKPRISPQVVTPTAHFFEFPRLSGTNALPMGILGPHSADAMGVPGVTCSIVGTDVKVNFALPGVYMIRALAATASGGITAPMTFTTTMPLYALFQGSAQNSEFISDTYHGSTDICLEVQNPGTNILNINKPAGTYSDLGYDIFVTLLSTDAE